MPKKAKQIKTGKPRPRPNRQIRGYDDQHFRMRRELLACRPFCEANRDGCTGWSEEAHHKVYPAHSLEDYMAVCRHCHQLLERDK